MSFSVFEIIDSLAGVFTILLRFWRMDIDIC